MKSTNLFVFCVLLLVSCRNEHTYNFNLPKLKTAPYDTILQVNIDEMQLAEPVLYGINILDSLSLTNRSFINWSNIDNKFDSQYVKETDSLVVIVDDKNIFFHTNGLSEMDFYRLPPFPPNFISKNTGVKYDSLWRKNELLRQERLLLKKMKIHQKEYPVYILNNSKSKTIITNSIINGDLFLQVQAKDRQGNWRPIEYNKVPSFICGTGHEDYILNPKRFIISSIKSYSGDFKTKLRVKFKNGDKTYYSNSFRGSVNESQFDTLETIRLMIKRFRKKGQKYKEDLIFLNN